MSEEEDIITRLQPVIMAAMETYNNKPGYIIKISIFYRRFSMTQEHSYSVDVISLKVNHKAGRVIMAEPPVSETLLFEDAVDSSTFMADIDLLRMYRIYQARLGCVRREPNYARSKTLKLLDRAYRVMMTDNLEDMNSVVFNLNPGAFIVPSPNIHQALATHIPRLYRDVRDAVLRLA